MRRTGKHEPKLDKPLFPDALCNLWRSWLEITRERDIVVLPKKLTGKPDLIELPLKYKDFDAYERVSGIKLEYWEVCALQVIDDLYLKSTRM